MPTEMQIISGRLQIQIISKTKPLTATIELMEKWVLPITGYLFLLYFVKIETWMLLKKPCIMH